MLVQFSDCPRKNFCHSYSVLAFEFIEKNYVALIEDKTKEM